MKTHGLCHTRFYNTWLNMKLRCSNSKHRLYSNYGGKGVNVCARWQKFENFRDDMYKSYLEHCELHTEKNTTIDKIDNTKDYSLENCRWATRESQANNKTNNLTYKGETAVNASRRLGGFSTLVSSRIYRGWSIEKAFTEPIKHRR